MFTVPGPCLLYSCSYQRSFGEKMLPLVFIGQGQLILSKAQSMGESVGAAHVGFMADVREEVQVSCSCHLSKQRDGVTLSSVRSPVAVLRVHLTGRHLSRRSNDLRQAAFLGRICYSGCVCCSVKAFSSRQPPFSQAIAGSRAHI